MANVMLHNPSANASINEDTAIGIVKVAFYSMQYPAPVNRLLNKKNHL